MCLELWSCRVLKQSFHPPAEGESLSLCVAKEKVTQEKGHPAWRFPAIHGWKVREAWPGFSTGLLPWRKGIDFHVDAPAGLLVHASPPHRGPEEQRAPARRHNGKIKSNRKVQNKSATSSCYLASASASAPASARRKRAVLPGAPFGAAGGWRKGRRLAGTMPASFSPAQGCAVKKPRNPPAHSEGRMPAERAIRGALSLAYFSLGKQREVGRSPTGERNSSINHKQRALSRETRFDQCCALFQLISALNTSG